MFRRLFLDPVPPFYREAVVHNRAAEEGTWPHCR